MKRPRGSAGPAAAVAVLASALAWGLTVGAGVARAEDFVSVRGAYYREPSTRVVQPMVDVERDSDSGVDVQAHFLIDAITSASAAAGTGVDSIFTETRNEIGFGLRKRWSRTDLTVGYKYSAESDYWSHGIGGSVGRRFWGDTARVELGLGVNFDSMSSRGRTPECAKPPSTSCGLDGIYAGLIYTQVLTPTLLAQVSAETLYLDGFQGNLYRSVPNFTYEHLPEKRQRNALAARVAYYIPQTSTGLQLYYRYYFDLWPGSSPGGSDPWHLQGHAIEPRVFQRVTRNLELRFSYRVYFQDNAHFWCDAIARTDCYAIDARYYSTDPKLGAVHTQFPELKVLWEAEALQRVPVLRWFAAGTFQISYGYYMQNTSFASAHVLQAGYRMPY